MVGERRWLNMKKLTFFIVERPPQPQNTSSEFKSDDEFNIIDYNLAPIEVIIA